MMTFSDQTRVIKIAFNTHVDKLFYRRRYIGRDAQFIETLTSKDEIGGKKKKK